MTSSTPSITSSPTSTTISRYIEWQNFLGSGEDKGRQPVQKDHIPHRWERQGGDEVLDAILGGFRAASRPRQNDHLEGYQQQTIHCLTIVQMFEARTKVMPSFALQSLLVQQHCDRGYNLLEFEWVVWPPHQQDLYTEDTRIEAQRVRHHHTALLVQEALQSVERYLKTIRWVSQ